MWEKGTARRTKSSKTFLPEISASCRTRVNVCGISRCSTRGDGL